MHGIRRVLPSVLLALGSLICIPLFLAALVLYPRSYWRADSFWFNEHNNVRAFISDTGHFRFHNQRLKPTAPYSITKGTGRRLGQEPGDPRPALRDSELARRIYFAGFGYTSGEDEYSHRRILLLPFWFILAALAAPPAVLFLHVRRNRRRHRLANNLCVRCAYDLRASPERCPECGQIQPRAAASMQNASTPAVL